MENDMFCQKYAKYAIKYAEYAKYVILKKICRICTPHFADDWNAQAVHWALIESRASSLPLGVTGPAIRLPPHDPSLAANWEVLRLLQVRKYLFQVT